MNESNLARSLFSGKPKAPARKKMPKGFTQIDSSLENSLDPAPINSQINSQAGSQATSEFESSNSQNPAETLLEDLVVDLTTSPQEKNEQEKKLENFGEISASELDIFLLEDSLEISKEEAQSASQSESKGSFQENLKPKSSRKSSKDNQDTPKEIPKKSRENSVTQISNLEIEILALKHQLQQKSQIILELETELRKALNVQTIIIESLKLRNCELELRLEDNLATSVLLQRSLAEISSQQLQPSDRLVDLEAQVNELQEQILKQAGQAAEYEAAIQHWKEQSLHHQRHALQLSGALERLMDERKTSKRSTKLEKELASQAEELMAALPSTTVILTTPEDSKIPGKVNLPSFLVRPRPALT